MLFLDFPLIFKGFIMGEMDLVSHKHKKSFENQRKIKKINKNIMKLAKIHFPELLDGLP